MSCNSSTFEALVNFIQCTEWLDFSIFEIWTVCWILRRGFYCGFWVLQRLLYDLTKEYSIASNYKCDQCLDGRTQLICSRIPITFGIYISKPIWVLRGTVYPNIDFFHLVDYPLIRFLWKWYAFGMLSVYLGIRLCRKETIARVSESVGLVKRWYSVEEAGDRESCLCLFT